MSKEIYLIGIEAYEHAEFIYEALFHMGLSREETVKMLKEFMESSKHKIKCNIEDCVNIDKETKLTNIGERIWFCKLSPDKIEFSGGGFKKCSGYKMDKKYLNAQLRKEIEERSTVARDDTSHVERVTTLEELNERLGHSLYHTPSRLAGEKKEEKEKCQE